MEINAYVTSDLVRHIVASKQYTDLATNSLFSIRDFRAAAASHAYPGLYQGLRSLEPACRVRIRHMHGQDTDRLQHEAITRVVIGCAFEVINELGAGYVESVYEKALLLALRQK